MSKKLKKKLIRIIICGIAFLGAVLISKFCIGKESGLLYYGMFIVIYVGIGYDIVRKAARKVFRGKAMDENFLMVIASVGAFFISECKEGVAVMLFYQIGEWFQSYAVGKSRASIKDLMDIRPDYAVVLRDNVEQTIDPSGVQIGETIVIKPGEKVPLDGTIVEGNTTLDTKALTGESLPKSVSSGEEIYSGCINQSGVVKVKVTKTFSESTVSKILDLVENATDKKAKTENFITKFARYYTPAIVCMATAVCLIPTVFFHGTFTDWLYRALSFLVISCPCALVISIPLGFFGGIGGAGKAGILVKGSSYLEILAGVDTVVMDKTGTLTKGVFEVEKVIPSENAKISLHNAEDDLLELAALAESYSLHPIAESLRKAYGGEFHKERIEDIEEIAGCGIIARIDGREIAVGNRKLMQKILPGDNGDTLQHRDDEYGTVCHVMCDKVYLGCIVIADEPREDAKECIQGLKNNGVKRVVMLTGDKKEAAAHIAEEVGIEQYYAELMPIDKVNIIEKLMSTDGVNIKDGVMLTSNTDAQSKDMLVTSGNISGSWGSVAFVGDGINDAPVIKRADVGIAMGGLGSDAAIEAADVVIMNDQPSKIATAMKISRKTLRIVRENIIFALGIKALILVLAALGIATMWAAVFADVGVAFIAILNSMRGLSTKHL